MINTVYKWAIFDNETEAVSIKNACNILDPGAITNHGSPPFVQPPATDYTIVIKHYQQDLWAVPLNERAQELLSSTVTLHDPDRSWFAPPPHVAQ